MFLALSLFYELGIAPCIVIDYNDAGNTMNWFRFLSLSLSLASLCLWLGEEHISVSVNACNELVFIMP